MDGILECGIRAKPRELWVPLKFGFGVAGIFAGVRSSLPALLRSNADGDGSWGGELGRGASANRMMEIFCNQSAKLRDGSF